jgi:predicted AlkP superfamily phosphohydrolase/phosphomutase
MKTIIIGFDAFDPNVFERLNDQGMLPNIAGFMQEGGYARFGVSTPPQSEVSWTSIATGLDASGHGIFDFVHRDPGSYTPYVSLLPTKRGLMGTQFIPPHEAQTIFHHAVDQGYPATSLWWPATFPARLESPVRTVPGLGTPDILGRLGAGLFFSPDAELDPKAHKTHVGVLSECERGSYQGTLQGPMQKKRDGTEQVGLDFRLDWVDNDHATLTLNKQSFQLVRGNWSPLLHLRFQVRFGVSVHGLTRAILSEHPAAPGIYFLPLQIHPLHAPWPYTQPKGLSKTLWNESGPYLSLGWPQDTTGLEEGFLNDEAFIELCESIARSRERAFLHQLAQFREGLVAIVFDSLDRIQHMFWKSRPEVIDRWYRDLDALLGRLRERILKDVGSSTRIVIVSDHGFTGFDYKVHLNAWMIEAGYLKPRESAEDQGLQSVEWGCTQAYAIGLNSVYINLNGREGEGCVPAEERRRWMDVIRKRLMSWKGPDGRAVVHDVVERDEVFGGSLAAHGPDLLIGYNHGYRASAETGLGQWEDTTIETNQDHWSGDHCMDADLVPGVVFSSAGLSDFPNPTFRDFPELVLGEVMERRSSTERKPSDWSDEDRDVLEERLRDLGYL